MRKLFCVVASLFLLGLAGVARANVFQNQGFDIAGPLGPSVTLNSVPSSSPSAADKWDQLMISGHFMTTFLADTTDPMGGGKMLVINSDGPSTGSSGNTVGQNISPTTLALHSTGTIDVELISGAVRIGFVDSANGGTFFDSGSVFLTSPQTWHTEHFTNLDFKTDIIEIQLYAPTNGEALVRVDNLSVKAIPEPATAALLLPGIGLLAFILRWRSHRAD